MKISLEEARKLGKVFVNHRRFYLSDESAKVALVKFDNQNKEYVHGSQIKPLFGPYSRSVAEQCGFVHSKNVYGNGGLTIVEVHTPDGEVYHGEAHCSLEDGYCKRRGVQMALGRALTNRRS